MFSYIPQISCNILVPHLFHQGHVTPDLLYVFLALLGKFEINDDTFFFLNHDTVRTVLPQVAFLILFKDITFFE